MLLREFLNMKVSCDYIEILDNKTNEKIWEGKFETVDNHIPFIYLKDNIIKWATKDNGIIIWI